MICGIAGHALQFERATDPALKEPLSNQAIVYRKLAAERAAGSCSTTVLGVRITD